MTGAVMVDLTIYFCDGTVENVAVQTLGVSYGGGCAASVDHLDLSDVDGKGVILTRTKFPTFERDRTDTFLSEVVLVPPERMQEAVLVKNGIETLAFRDKDGAMVRPDLALLFGFEETRSHIGGALLGKIGLGDMPASVVEKFADGEEDEGGFEDDDGVFFA